MIAGPHVHQVESKSGLNDACAFASQRRRMSEQEERSLPVPELRVLKASVVE